MGVNLSEIAENTRIIFHIHHNEHQLDLGGILKKHLENKIALIHLDYDGPQKLSFEHVTIEMECPQADGIPLIWPNVKIVNYKNSYIMQAPTDASRTNRRSSYRVAIEKKAWLRMSGKEPRFVILKDLSVSGFSITDRNQELNLNKGDLLSILFEDAGYCLDLSGRVVRIGKCDNGITYGLIITNICPSLSAYLNIKQRPRTKSSLANSRAAKASH